MRHVVRALAAGGLAVALVAPGAASAAPGEIVTNPFGNLSLSVLTQPDGATPGTARVTIHTDEPTSITGQGDTVYFGLRIMGVEDLQMTGFNLVGGSSSSCVVSDFAGRNTSGGWQLGDAFGAEAPTLGSANSNMRMVGGFLRKECGNLRINLAFTARPLVTFYGAFFGLEPAPWHDNYGEAPWDTIPTGGDASYQNWWDLWGTFDTLGYSNACTSVSGTTVTCG